MTHANVLWNVARRLWGADCLIEAACRRAEHTVGADSPRADVGIFYGPHNKLRWDGEGWIGTDTNRLWLKSEGFSNMSTVSDGDHEALYGRSIPHVRYFDAQVGVRADLDSGPTRTWAALGHRGTCAVPLRVCANSVYSGGGHVAGRVTGSNDLLLTQRWIAQPEAELNS